MDTAIGGLIEGALPTIFVSDMDAAVRFYTEVLGLKLTYRAGEHWASLDAGGGTSLGLHPAAPDGSGPRPGEQGGIQLGFNVAAPLEEVVSALEARGVAFPGGIKDDGAVRLAFFSDPDGNEHYLCESK